MFFLLVILFVLCVNHFDGFEQDCILYTLQSINRIFPGRFIDDPAFMFGNQDSFSIFSVIYSVFIRLFPIDTAALVLTLLTHCGLAVSFAWLARKWTQRFHCQCLAFPITLFFFSMYAYGEFRNDMWNTIKTIEAYPVARTLAVSFGFWGLAHLFDKNKWITPVIFFIGSLVHPLTVGWGLPLWMFYHFRKTRLLIMAISLLFPATILIGKNPWAAYPPSWVHIGWDMEGVVSLVQNLSLNLLFLVLASAKFLQNKALKKFALAETLVFAIAVYWFVVSVFTHHIFLFQIQTFRILWLCQVSIVVIQFFVGLRLYVTKIRKCKALNIWDKVFLVISLAYWIDSPFVIVGALTAAILLATRNKPFYGHVKIGLVCLWLAATAFSAYWIVFLHMQYFPDLYQSYQTFIQELFAVTAALALAVSLVCPKWRITVAIVMLLCAAEILWGNTIFPKQNFSLAFVLAIAVFGALDLSAEGKTSLGRLLPCGMLVVALALCAVLNYDHRDSVQKSKEKAMNQFVDAPPFSYIKKRGRILYSVKDYAGALPRIHFLSGAYYDEQYEVGSIFFEGHKNESYAREKRVFLGAQPTDDEWDKLKWQLRKRRASEYLFEPDSLIARTQHLCQGGEITHLIADLPNLPFAKEDSLTLWYKDERIYLYPCESLSK